MDDPIESANVNTSSSESIEYQSYSVDGEEDNMMSDDEEQNENEEEVNEEIDANEEDNMMSDDEEHTEIEEAFNEEEVNLRSDELTEDEQNMSGSSVPAAPEDGMCFESLMLLEQYLNAYGRAFGFQWRIRSSRKHPTSDEICGARIVCSKQGFNSYKTKHAATPQPTTREGCGAYVTCSKRKNGLWVINMVNLNHSHDLDPSNSALLRRNRSIPMHTKYLLHVNYKAGIGVRKTYNLEAIQQPNNEELPMLERDCRNFLRGEQVLKLKSGDAKAVQLYFEKMQANNANFFYSVDLDQHSRLRNLFWADARSRAACTEFGDVVSFDTTYRKNKYKMPVPPFVGINHHGQSILLGCALISSEEASTFEWVLKAWLSCMSSVAPQAIITDQDPAIAKAIKEVFPTTRHRWCLWHILKKVEQKLGSYRQYKKIHGHLLDVVYRTHCPSEFDDAWNKFVVEYGLNDNSWIKTLSAVRERWAPAYLNDCFWAGMQTTQRSEGMNAFFGSYVNSKTTLKGFVERYDDALRDKAKKEFAEDVRSKLSRIECATNFEIEEIFKAVYTLRKFKEVQIEANKCNHCMPRVPVIMGTIKQYVVVEKVGKPPISITYKVNFDSDTLEISCSCKHFEMTGIICRHMIRVWDTECVSSIPEKYITRRWRKDVVRAHSMVKVPYIDFDMSPDLKRYHDLKIEFEPIASKALTDEDSFVIARDGLRNLRSALDQYCASVMTRHVGHINVPITSGQNRGNTDEGQSSHGGDGTSMGQQEQFQDPIYVTSKGRPTNKRKRSAAEVQTSIACRRGRGRGRGRGSGRGRGRGKMESTNNQEGSTVNINCPLTSDQAVLVPISAMDFNRINIIGSTSNPNSDSAGLGGQSNVGAQLPQIMVPLALFNQQMQRMSTGDNT